jgi:2-hydroxy-3-oxopropionate reductase
MDTVAFIGLGVMGSPMAVRLQQAGYHVRGHTRTEQKAGHLVQAGGTLARTVAEAVHGADVVATMLPDSPDVRAVLTGPDGALANATGGALVIDFSSISAQVATELGTAARDRGLRPLDAPVSGGEAGAVGGRLSIMVGGAAADVEAARPVLEVVGRTVRHVGPSGSGQIVKSANQLLVGGHLQLLAEATVFLEAHGVDLDRALDALAGGLAGSAVLEQKREGMLARDFRPGGRLDLHHKDMGNLTAAAREAGVVIPLGAMVAELIASARANGDGALDHSALLRGVERLSGRASWGG